jgi:hypothetical protein
MRPQSHNGVLVACLLALTSACTDADRSWVGTADTVAGVPVIRNPSTPVHPPGAVTLTEVWSQAGPATGLVWEQPRNLAAGPEGIFILDRSARRILRLDAATGVGIAAFGREGDGPGELRSPARIVLQDGDVVVLDLSRRTLERFGPDGSHRSSMQPNAILFSIEPLGPDRFLAPAFGTDAPLNVLRGDSLYPVTPPDPLVGIDAGFASCERFFTFGELPVRLSCTRPFFQLFTTAGRPVREVFLDRGPELRSDAEIATYLDGIRQTLAESGESAAMIDAFVAGQRERHRMRRPWQRVERDATTGLTVLLEQEGEDFGGGPATVHLFDGEGRYLAAVERAEAWWEFALLDGDIIALVRAPDTDLVRAVRYRMTGLRRRPSAR